MSWECARINLEIQKTCLFFFIYIYIPESNVPSLTYPAEITATKTHTKNTCLIKATSLL